MVSDVFRPRAGFDASALCRGGAAGRRKGLSPATSYDRRHGAAFHGGSPERCDGAVAPPVAVIDGPYDAAALSDILAQAPVDLGNGRCSRNPCTACDHGTFVMGILGARRDALIPGLCPGCMLLHVPLFVDEDAPWASVTDLADAIAVAVAAGARLINLSLAILGDDRQNHDALATVLDRAEMSGVIIVAAAGNQGRAARGQIVTHPAAIPVVAVDATGKVVPSSNLSPEIARRGVAALGSEVLGYGTRGKLIRMSGTSVAAAVATGILAQVWSSRPDATGADISAAVAALRRRGDGAPPMLDRVQLLGALDAIRGTSKHATASAGLPAGAPRYQSLRGKSIMDTKRHMVMPAGLDSPIATAMSAPVAPAGGVGGCSCGAAGFTGNGAAVHAIESGFVYAIGTVEAEYPNLAIEREMQVLAHDMGIKIEPDPDMPMKPSDDRRWQHAVLSGDRRRARYIARQLSWRLTIENIPVFILRPRDPSDFDELIDCLNRPKFPKVSAGRGKSRGKEKSEDEALFAPPEDLDVVVGVTGSQTPDGIEVLTDHLFTITPDQLAPSSGAHLYGYLAQLSDNYGLTDQDRAYNFLAARYKIPYDKLRDVHEGYELAAAPTMSSRLSGSHRIVDVILAFRGTQTMTERKYFVRVDVTHEFPMIVSGLNPYLGR